MPSKDTLAKLSGPFLHGTAMVATIAFLVLPAITGPGLGSYWLVVSAAAGSWQLGGLGACQVGATCASGGTGPSDYGIVKIALNIHFVVAALFLLMAGVGYWSVRSADKRPKVAMRARHLLWAGPLVVIVALVADVVARVKIGNTDGVQNVSAEPTFWLVLMAPLWAAVWAYLSYKHRKTVLSSNARRDEYSEDPITKKRKTNNGHSRQGSSQA